GVPAPRWELQAHRAEADRSRALNDYAQKYARYASAPGYQYVEVNEAADWSLCVRCPKTAVLSGSVKS
ncbi:MAG: hypothetical protein AAF346_17375, partial [Pseudomonadota bacterium]